MKKKVLTMLFIIFLTGCRCPVRKTISSCTGKISAVFLIESDNCDDLDMMRTWLDSCHVSRAILVLCDIGTWSDNKTLAALLDTSHYKVDTILYSSPVIAVDSSMSEVSLSGNKMKFILPREGSNAEFETNKYAFAGVDEAVAISSRNVLFLNNENPLYFNGLMSIPHFINAVHDIGFDSVICRDNILQGGDILSAGDHIFLGYNSLKRFSPKGKDTGEAKRAIRKLYGFNDSISIDFIISPDSDLYHLDLFLTCTGQNTDGKYQFFIASIGQNVFAANRHAGPSLKVALDELYPQFDSLLKLRFKDKYQLDRVPVFMDYYLLSPLNGITDCVNDSGLYYFPYPVGGLDHSEADSAQIKGILDKAYSVMSKRIKVKKIGVDVQYMVYAPASGAQSLHCMMSVIRRSSN